MKVHPFWIESILDEGPSVLVDASRALRDSMRGGTASDTLTSEFAEGELAVTYGWSTPDARKRIRTVIGLVRAWVEWQEDQDGQIGLPVPSRGVDAVEAFLAAVRPPAADDEERRRAEGFVDRARQILEPLVDAKEVLCFAKAKNLAGQSERVFEESRIISSHIPVFLNEGDDPRAVGFYVDHRLRIVYWNENARPEEISISMDSRGLEQLAAAIERAKKKIVQIEAQKRSGYPLIRVEGDK